MKPFKAPAVSVPATYRVLRSMHLVQDPRADSDRTACVSSLRLLFCPIRTQNGYERMYAATRFAAVAGALCMLKRGLVVSVGPR